MNVKIEKSWKKVLKNEFESLWFEELSDFIREQYASGTPIYPPPGKIFEACARTPFDKVRVVILGQDPYHGPGQAMGLSFSVQENIPNPPSLKNIFKEIESDLGNKAIAQTKGGGDLTLWAKQGVLLLNATLTVEKGKAASHSDKGWQNLTDAMIRHLSDKRTGIVFLLWGNFARKKKDLIDQSKHHILESPHPSPLSAHAGFFGCKHFSKCNMILKDNPIRW